MKFKRLFEPLSIKGLTLKNRVVMTAIHLVYSEDGSVNERIKEFYFRRAEGGIAMAIVGGVASDKYIGYPGMLRLDDDRFIPGFAELAEGMHARGSKLCVQLLQTGRYGVSLFVEDDTDTISASAVTSMMSGETPRAMTAEEIKTVQRRAGEAALRAKKAGADCVQLTAASGYMISQFLSPVTNLREDEYGGSFKNRCRFGLEMVQEVKKAVGEDFPLLVRVAGNEFIPGGNGLEGCVEFCKMLEAAGVDMIDVTGGWHETRIPQLPGDVPRGGFVYLAKAVKDAVSIPVLTANRHNDPYEAERVLALGQADVIGQCRTQVADPCWVNKVQSGKEKLIKKCLACNQGCLSNVFSFKPCKCLVNPDVGDEYLKEEAEKTSGRKLLVVGGGVAGCEFAYRAAEKGHEVTIWEKSDALGGQLPLVATPPAKSEFKNLLCFYRSAVKEAGVNVVLNKEATAGSVREGGFDAVIIATGASPKMIKLPGSSSIPVYSAEDILSGKVVAGRNVVVVGGGSVGCETADYLAQEASLSEEKLFFMMTQQAEKTEVIESLLNTSDRNIAVVDIARVGATFDFGVGWPFLKDLKRLGVKTYSKTEITNVTDSSVEIKYTDRKSGETVEKKLPCNTIVISVGYKSDDSLYEQLEDSGIEIYNIGDSANVAKIIDAISQAKQLALKI